MKNSGIVSNCQLNCICHAVLFLIETFCLIVLLFSCFADEVGSIDGECLLNCSHCDSNFSKLCSLRDHLSSVHGFHLEKHVCSKCGADFSLKSQLEKHLALHSPTSQVSNNTNVLFFTFMVLR